MTTARSRPARLAIGVWLLTAACGTTRMKPPAFPVADAQIPAFARDLRISVNPRFTRTPLHALPVSGTEPVVSDDEFTAAIVERIEQALRSRGVSIDHEAQRSLDISVVKISLEPSWVTTCVIDFNRWLGDGRVRGIQSRAWSVRVRKACGAALSQAAIDTLRDPETFAYVNGDPLQ